MYFGRIERRIGSRWVSQDDDSKKCADIEDAQKELTSHFATICNEEYLTEGQSVLFRLQLCQKTILYPDDSFDYSVIESNNKELSLTKRITSL